MCNLYTMTSAPEAMRQLFGLPWPLRTNLQPMQYVRPTNQAPIVRLDTDGEREPAMLRWWLLPRWAKEISNKFAMFNTFGETIDEKASFKGPWKEGRRCLVPATGFFEHTGPKGDKTRHRITLRNAETFAFAGIWERDNQVPDGPVESFAIITTVANATVAAVHPKGRMPVSLSANDHDHWLDPATSPDEAKSLFRTYPNKTMKVEVDVQT